MTDSDNLDWAEYVEDYQAKAELASQAGPDERDDLAFRIEQFISLGRAHDGDACCGTTSRFHRPWCYNEPRQYRQQQGRPGDARNPS